MSLLSPEAQIFTAIQDRITAQAPLIKWIDHDFGQLEEDRPAVLYPCALIEWGQIGYEPLSGVAQTATATITITIGTSPVTNSNSITPIQFREKALEFFEAAQQVANALNGWEPTGFGRMTRIASDRGDTPPNLRTRVLVFQLAYNENASVITYQKVARPEPNANGDILP